MLDLAIRSICGGGTELLVGGMRRACNRVAAIGGRLGGGLLGFGAADDDKATALLFAVED